MARTEPILVDYKLTMPQKFPRELTQMFMLAYFEIWKNEKHLGDHLDPFQIALDLSHVSKEWRSVAIGTPDIWAIHYSVKPSLEWVQVMLERSGASDNLSIYTWGWHAYPQGSYLDILRPYLNRIGVLEDIHCRVPIDDIVQMRSVRTLILGFISTAAINRLLEIPSVQNLSFHEEDGVFNRAITLPSVVVGPMNLKRLVLDVNLWIRGPANIIAPQLIFLHVTMETAINMSIHAPQLAVIYLDDLSNHLKPIAIVESLIKFLQPWTSTLQRLKFTWLYLPARALINVLSSLSALESLRIDIPRARKQPHIIDLTEGAIFDGDEIDFLKGLAKSTEILPCLSALHISRFRMNYEPSWLAMMFHAFKDLIEVRTGPLKHIIVECAEFWRDSDFWQSLEVKTFQEQLDYITLNNYAGMRGVTMEFGLQSSV